MKKDESTDNIQKKKSSNYNSILEGLNDEYTLTSKEYLTLHLFYITYCLAKGCRKKTKKFSQLWLEK